MSLNSVKYFNFIELVDSVYKNQLWEELLYIECNFNVINADHKNKNFRGNIFYLLHTGRNKHFKSFC